MLSAKVRSQQRGVMRDTAAKGISRTHYRYLHFVILAASA
jgi:hypothetical protein